MRQKKYSFLKVWSGLSNIIYRSYHANFIYCTVVENSIWVLNGLNPQETLRILLCNYYQCSIDSKVLIHHYTLPTPLHSFSFIQLHDWICQYTTLFMYQVMDCTRFSFTRFFVFFEMYQVSKYQVFQKSIRFKVPGWRKYQVKSTRTWYFFVQPGKKNLCHLHLHLPFVILYIHNTFCHWRSFLVAFSSVRLRFSQC